MIRHLIILLVIGAACYGAVNWVYRLVDDGFAEMSTSAPDLGVSSGGTDSERPAGSGDDGSVSAPESPVDIGVITSRNIFLPPSIGTTGRGDTDGLFSGGDSSVPDLLLIGTILQSDGRNRAVLYEIERQRQLLVKEGDEVRGATITQILPGKVVISRRGRSEILDQADAAAYRRERQSGSGVHSEHNSLGRQAAVSTTVPQPTERPVIDNGIGEPQDREGGLQVDPETFGKESDGVIVKGRINR